MVYLVFMRLLQCLHLFLVFIVLGVQRIDHLKERERDIERRERAREREGMRDFMFFQLYIYLYMYTSPERER